MTESFGQQLDAVQIARLLPHRYPYLLVDKVLEWEHSRRILALKQVSVNEPHFPGHFPGNPIMPGVLIIEALAQTCGLLAMLSTDSDKSDNIKVYLTGVDKARFRHLVVPGDSLQLVVTLIHKRSNLYRFTAKAMVDVRVACTAELLCYWGP